MSVNPDLHLLCSGAIIFGLNNKTDSSGGVSLNTYLVIIGIMCAGPFIALLASQPEKVQRKDGVKIVLRNVPWKQTLKEWIRVLSSKDVSFHGPSKKIQTLI